MSKEIERARLMIEHLRDFCKYGEIKLNILREIYSIEDALNRAEENEKELDRYKEIEEELGISLEVFVKLNKTNKIYDIDEDDFVEFDYIDIKNKRLVCTGDFSELSGRLLEDYYYFKDFGITWALTKEGLKEVNDDE